MDWTVIVIVTLAGMGLVVMLLRYAGILRPKKGGCCNTGGDATVPRQRLNRR